MPHDRFQVAPFVWEIDSDEVSLGPGRIFTLADLTPKDHRGERLHGLVAAIRSGKVRAFEGNLMVRCHSDQLVWIRVVGAAEIGPRGESLFQGFAFDISDEVSRLEEVRAERDQLRGVLERLPDGLLMVGKDHAIRFANLPIGYVPYRTPDELIGRQFEDVLPAAIAERFHRHLDLATETGRLQVFRYEIEHRGTSRTREARVMPGGGSESIVVTRDITAEARTEEALSRREAILSVVAYGADRFLRGRPTADTINDMLGLLGRATGVGRVYVFESLEPPPATLRLRIAYEWCAEGIPSILDDPMLQEADPSALGAGSWIPLLLAGEVVMGSLSQFGSEERALLDAFGVKSVVMAPITVRRRFWGFMGFADLVHERAWARPEADALSAAAAVLGAALEQQESEEALRHSEERWRKLVDNHPAPILVCTGGTIAYLNPAALQVIGATSPQEAIGISLQRLMPDSLALACLDVETRAAPKPQEQTLQTLDEQERIVEVVAVPITYESHPAIQMVLQDVTERKRYESQLIEARDRAEEMNRLKTSFLANMSHEIRTPLTSIIGYADILKEETSDKSRTFSELIGTAASRLMDTLNSVLALAQLEGGSRRLHYEPLDPGEQARQIRELFQTRFAQKGLRLDLNIDPPSGTTVYLDRRALGRILVNLVDNAFKFTETGGVTIDIEQDAHILVIRVSDTGIGIGAEFLPHIFDEFKQESDGLSRKYGGSGLGLAITRRLVELMGGLIEVDSDRGKGTVFTVSLPLLAGSDPEVAS